MFETYTDILLVHPICLNVGNLHRYFTSSSNLP